MNQSSIASPVFAPSRGLAEFLIALRRSGFASVEDAAAACELSVAALRAYERGIGIPALDVIARLVAACGQGGRFDAAGREQLLAQANTALAVVYATRPAWPSWAALVAAATTAEEPQVAVPQWHQPPAVRSMIGREREQAFLQHRLVAERCRLTVIAGAEGSGRTTLVAAVARRCVVAFEQTVWLRLHWSPAVEECIETCLMALAQERISKLPHQRSQRIERLVELLRLRRILLVFDGYEHIQGPERTGYLRLFEALGDQPHRSCVIVTDSLEDSLGAIGAQSIVLAGLDRATADALVGADHARRDLGAEAVAYGGNPLALGLAANHAKRFGMSAHIAELRATWDEGQGLAELLAAILAAHSSEEQLLLGWLALDPGPIDIQSLVIWAAPHCSESSVSASLDGLLAAGLIVGDGVCVSVQDSVGAWWRPQVLARCGAEILSGAFDLVRKLALLNSMTAEQARAAQARLVLTPLLAWLQQVLGPQGIDAELMQHLNTLRRQEPIRGDYIAGNLCNLLIQLHGQLEHVDLSALRVRGAFLRDTAFRHSSLHSAYLSQARFRSAFGPVLAVAIHPQGGVIATGSTAGQIRLWRLEDLNPIIVLEGHGDWIRALAFSPDGSLLASASDDGSVRLWSTASGAVRHILPAHSGRAMAVGFADEGRLLVSGGEDGMVCVWDVGTGRLKSALAAHDGWVCDLAVLSTGRILTGSSSGHLCLWDFNNHQRHLHMELPGTWIWAVAASPDGALFASGGDEPSVRLWDGRSGELLAVFDGHTTGTHALAFSPDGRLLASAGTDMRIRIWDVARRRTIGTLTGHTNWVRSLAFNYDSRLLVSGGSDQSVRLWDVELGQCLHVLQGHDDGIWSLAFAPDGRTLACGSHQATRVWRFDGGSAPVLANAPQRIWSLAFAPDGLVLAGVLQHAVAIWSSTSGRLVRTLQGHDGWVRAVAFAPDGRLLASGSEDQSVRLWDVDRGVCLRVFEGHERWVWAVAFSPDGQLVASSGDDRCVIVWDARTGALLHMLQGHENSIWTVAFSPDGRLLASGSDDTTIRLWEPLSGRVVEILTAHTGQVWSLDFHPSGELMASGGVDGDVLIWDTQDWSVVSRLRGSGYPIRALAFAPDGQRLAIGRSDGTVGVWDLPTERLERDLTPPRPYEGLDLRAATGLSPALRPMLRMLGGIIDEPDRQG